MQKAPIADIAVYGGSFNPPHIGHASVAQQLLTTNLVSRIIVLPDGERSDKSYGIDPTHREAIIRIFFRELRERGLDVELEDYFLKKPGLTTTMEVEDYFLKKGSRVHHIFGSDVIDNMPNWSGNRGGYLENELHKIFIQRKGSPAPKNINMKNYRIVDLDIPEVSSSVIKQMLKTRDDVNHLMTPGVANYLLKNPQQYAS